MKEELRVAAATRHPGPLWRRSGESRYRIAGHGVTVRNGTRDVAMVAEIFSRHTYRPPAEIAPRSVLDLGANIGAFAVYARATWPVERLVCVEPDPENLAVLRRNVDAEIIAACAGTREGATRFRSGRFSESRIAADGDVELPTFDTFRLGHFDLAKIDIEGAEWPLLADGRFAQLAEWLVMEYHSVGCPGEPHRTVEALLSQRGYRLLVRRSVGGHGVVWARSLDPATSRAPRTAGSSAQQKRRAATRPPSFMFPPGTRALYMTAPALRRLDRPGG